MQRIFLDSDIIIDFLKMGQGMFPQIVTLQAVGKIEMYISSVTVFELFSGASAKRDESKILELISNLKTIPFDEHLAKFAGEIRRDKKLSIALADFFIAATSLFIGAHLATRNREHFKGIKGLKFFDLKSSIETN